MSLTFPARFMLAAAMNPCPCGFHNDRTRECHCTPPMIQRYISKISGPLLDRIDIHIDVPAVNYKEMRSTTEPENSAKILERVVRARELQLTRFSSERQKLYCNAQMPPQSIRKFCELSADCERLLERAMAQQGLSARAHDRILKVARTIADLEGNAAARAQTHRRGDSVSNAGPDVLGVRFRKKRQRGAFPRRGCRIKLRPAPFAAVPGRV